MKQQKVNSCFNSRRQQEPTRERVIGAKDGQAQSGGSERRGSGDVRVVDAFSRAGGEAAGERRRVDVTRGKPGFMGRGELRRDVKERRWIRGRGGGQEKEVNRKKRRWKGDSALARG